MRSHALDRGERGVRFRIFGGDGYQQPSGNGDARRHRGDQADDKYESVTHVLGHAELPGQEVELARVDGRYLSAEAAASFTGRVIGLFAVSGDVVFDGYCYSGSER